MKHRIKSMLAKLAETQLVRSAVVHLIYPNVVRILAGECVPDVASASGVVEQFSWKSHAYQVLSSEMATAVNCCPNGILDCSRDSRENLFNTVLQRIKEVPGDIMEFGVSSGESFLWFLKRCPDRHIYGFDSFAGLPEDWWTRPKGSFQAEPPRFTETNGTLIHGWFEDSMPDFFSKYSGTIALIHVDCDIYSASIYSLKHAIGYCRPGSVILFDEYYNYPGFAAHEFRAWREIQLANNITAECIGYDGRRAAFQISKLG